MVTFVGSTTDGGLNDFAVSSLTPALPSGSPGDLVITSLSCRGVDDIPAPPAGWTEVVTVTSSSTSTRAELRVYSAIDNGSLSAPTWTFASPGIGVASVVRYSDHGGIGSFVSSNSAGTSSLTYAPPAITGDYVVSFACSVLSSSTHDLTCPVSETSRVDLGSSTCRVTHGVSDTQGPDTSVWSDIVSSTWAAARVSILPAASPGLSAVVWNGTAWISGDVQTWDGTQWV